VVFCSGHFTQVVWKSSAELGVGVATAGGRVVVVANYHPPGIPPDTLQAEINKRCWLADLVHLHMCTLI